ncbi:MAG TPA: non-homologous end-joining DNA ligase [Verrucomicrobiae bacterium]|nr:non-homologous end-joining DNA ligase [Verrucomicrobiae bacterium]
MIPQKPRSALGKKAPPFAEGDATAIKLNGKLVAVSNLNKVLYPKAGFTKGQIIDYYIRISPVLLPHLKGRPLTLKRYPNGVEKPFFYEKRCPSHRPDWVDTAKVWSKENQEHIEFCVLNDLPSLVWAANLADLELHTGLARGRSILCPTMVVFDLDPGAPADIIQCAEVALALKELLDEMKLESLVKTSGSKGLQVCVPLNSSTTYETTKPFARMLAETLERRNPGLVVSKMAKNLRSGKVFIDWSQNDSHKTTVCVYSLRARERPTVSTPVTWDEVRSALKNKDAGRLSFVSDDLLKRVEEQGDLFEPVLKLKQKLPAA